MLLIVLGPLESVAPWHPWWVIPVIVAVFVLSNRAMKRITDQRLITAVTPKGPILQWQMAGTRKRMDAILEAWGPEGRRWAGRTLLIDVPFLLAYGSFLSLACSMAAVFFAAARAPVGKWIYALASWAAVLAAALDLTENALLARMLRPFEGDGLPRTMTTVSKVKWGIALAVVPFAAAGLLFDLVGCRFGCG